MTTTPPQPPQQNPFQPEGGGYAPPPGPPQYQPPAQPGQPQYGQPPQAPYQQGQPGLPPQQGQPYQPGQPPQQGQPFPGQPFQGQPFQGQPQQFPQYGPGDQQGTQYQQPQQPPQYGQQQPGQFPQGQQFGQGLQCRFCGGVPAVDATVRGHQGFVIVMRFLKLQGPFCKTCGVAATRDMTGKSMVQGWWGIGSLIINPITMLMNLATFSKKFKNLPEPAPGAPGRPMNPGKPLFQRPVALGLLIPIAVFTLIVVSNLNKASSADVGSCVYNKGTSAKPNVKVVDCTSSDAKYKVVGKIPGVADSNACARYEESTVSYTDERGSSKYTLCLAPN